MGSSHNFTFQLCIILEFIIILGVSTNCEIEKPEGRNPSEHETIRNLKMKIILFLNCGPRE